jgi:hypothetical protein
LDLIYAEVAAKNTPIMHLVGISTQYNVHPDQFKYMGLFPEKINKTVSESFLYLLPNYQNHATYRFTDDRVLTKWLETGPPLLRNDSDWKPRGGTSIFGKAKIKGISLDYPMFALQEVGGFKNMVFLGENLWRYRMHAYLETENFELFDDWIHQLTTWLTTREDKRKFRVYPIKNLFTGDEKTIIKGQVYNDNYQPVTGAEVKLTLNNPDKTQTDLFLNEVQDGVYQLELSNLSEGGYRFNAVGTHSGKTIGQDLGEFSIGQSAIEFVNLKANEALMRQLALRTGGSFVWGKNLPALADSILQLETLKPLSNYTTTTQGLQRFVWPILLILSILSVEWVLRKRNGLV